MTRRSLAMTFSIVGMLCILLFPSRSKAAWLIDTSGTLIHVDGLVLGDEVENEGEQVEPNEQEQQNQEELKQKLAREAEARKKMQEAKKEVRRTTIQNKEKHLEVKQEVRKEVGKDPKPVETKLPDNEPLHVERPKGDKLEIKAGENDELEIKGEKVRARTNFPLTIGENNELIITKKDGTQKTVAILPDQAVAKLQEKGFVAAADSGELTESSDGSPVYKFVGTKEKKVFGLFRAKFQNETAVSAETGEVVEDRSTETSFARRLLERFAL